MAEQVARNANRKSPSEYQITRERSFIRTNSQQNANKRRSLAFNPNMVPGQMRNGKPAIELYRPPKLNYNLQQSTSSSMIYPSNGGHLLQQSKSNTALHQQMHMLANRHPMQHHPQHAIIMQPMHMGQMGPPGVNVQSSQHPLVNSPSSGNILHANTQRVKFANEPQVQNVPSSMLQNNAYQNPLQRSKSLSSADAITRGIAGLGLVLGNEATDLGPFPPDVQALIDQAIAEPNNLPARSLMQLATHVMQRTVEGRRHALPASRLCIAIISKESKETFLEALINNCRQWYQEREKILYAIQGMKSPSRSRFVAFMAFLTEMFCQLKRRQLQLRTQCDGAPPHLVLLTLLAKCCEDCVRPPVRSLSEIECLFFVLTCIGRDVESELPQQLDSLLGSIRDAFLNSSASAPTIRRTLLQLIELHASHWQLPGNTVLYYYPSSK